LKSDKLGREEEEKEELEEQGWERLPGSSLTLFFIL
jgi:hypothetical protein